jgi:hypothetical protein
VGLKEALVQQWTPVAVVGASQLILGQLKRDAEPPPTEHTTRLSHGILGLTLPTGKATTLL